jgi:DNA-binding NarL/FixJ family response regulator
MVQERIRVMIVHCNPAVRDGLAACLRFEADMVVIGTTSNGAHVVDLVAELRPDVVLMQRSGGGIEATRRLVEAQPGTRVAILSGSGGPEVVAEALQSGALGFVYLGLPPSEIASLLRGVVERRGTWGRMGLPASP